MKIKEIECSSFGYRDDSVSGDRNTSGIVFSKEAEIIGKIINAVASVFLRNIKPSLELPYTESIVCGCFDSDTCGDVIIERLKEIHLAKPDDEMHRGYNVIELSRKKIKEFSNNEDRNRYILYRIYFSLVEYLENFKFGTKGLLESFHIVNEHDFHFGITRTYRHKKLNIGAGLQEIKGLDCNENRLVIFDFNTKKIEYYELPNRIQSFLVLKDIDISSAAREKKLPGFMYNVVGWKRDRFYFNWGDEMFGEVERFRFSLKTKELKRIN